MKNSSTQKTEMSRVGVQAFLEAILEKYGDVFHEWNTSAAERFFKASGISKRNWRIYMRHEGMADGSCWTLRAIAEAENGISHVRVWQIVRQTRKNLARFAAAGQDGSK